MIAAGLSLLAACSHASAYEIVPLIDHGLQIERPDWEKGSDCTVSSKAGDVPKLVVTKIIQDVSGEIGKGGTFRYETTCSPKIKNANRILVGDQISSIVTTLEAVLILQDGPHNCRYHAIDRDLTFPNPVVTSLKHFTGGCGPAY